MRATWDAAAASPEQHALLVGPPDTQAFVQLPVLQGARGRLWRAARGAALPLARRVSGGLTGHRAYRGVRLTEAELARALDVAGLRAAARADDAASPYRYAREVF